MKPDYEGDKWAIYVADCIEIMNGMPEGIVDLAIFSPPFSDLFVYSDSERDMGNCGSHAEFMDHYDYFAKALYRVLKPGRMACVHCSDLPARKGKDGFIGMHDFSGDLIRAHQQAKWVYHARCTVWKDPVIEMQRTKALGLLYKQLKKDSSRSRVGMPDYILFFRKDQENPDPITHDPKDLPVSMWQELASPVWMTVNQTNVLNGRMARGDQDEKHICPLQLDVIERCITLYSNPGDLVMDPFSGIGSSGYQSLKMNRSYVGCELKPEYARQSARFLQGAEQQSGSLLDLLNS
jgi:DNA modification methylase